MIHTLVSAQKTLIFAIIQDLIADILFSILYLVELQLNSSQHSNPEIADKSPRWLYTYRTPEMFTIAIVLSGINLFSMAVRTTIADNKLRTFFQFTTLLDFICCIPFLVLSRFSFGRFIYIPYFLRSLVIITRLKRVLRLRGDLFSVDPLQEKLVVLVVTIMTIIYNGMCTFNYFEANFQPPDPTNEGRALYRAYNLMESLYFVIITVSTVGYGDISPKSTPGQFVVVIIILVALIVVPGLISSVAETISMRTAG
ncbi:potassium channel, sub T, member 2, partial [Quaeritorhiza haematococci]